MVNQYKYLVDNDGYFEQKEGCETYYDYFKSGGDGLAWDCINILGLAESRARLYEMSPIWNCQINGKKLSLSDMDYGYIEMIRDWLKRPKGNWDYAVKAHHSVEQYLREHGNVR